MKEIAEKTQTPEKKICEVDMHLIYSIQFEIDQIQLFIYSLDVTALKNIFNMVN